MLTAFKILTMLWPFVKEMFFGQKTASEILNQNKLRASFVLVVALSFMLNVFTISKVIAISREYITLNKKYKELESTRRMPVVPGAEKKDAVKEPRPSPVLVVPAVVKTFTNVPKPDTRPSDDVEAKQRYERLRKQLEEIKRREETE